MRQFLYAQTIKQGTNSRLTELNQLSLLVNDKEKIKQNSLNSYRSSLLPITNGQSKIYFINHQNNSFRKPSFSALANSLNLTACLKNKEASANHLIPLSCQSNKLELSQSAFFYGNLKTNYLYIGNAAKQHIIIVVLGDLTVEKLLHLENVNNSTVELIVAGSIYLENFKIIKSHNLQALIHSANENLKINSLVSNDILCQLNNPDGNRLSLEAAKGISIFGDSQNTASLGCTFTKDKSHWPELSFLGYTAVQ